MSVLAPEHLEDLYRSGLSDDTIRAALFTAVPPQELNHLTKVTSAYALPYFNLDGSVNCFKRWKLFPSITTADGHTQKYYQPAGSSTHVYLPPLLSWKSTARHNNQALVFTEGEKKAACACQHGLVTAGIAGVWNWRQRLDIGEAFMIPTLDQFIWKDRTVELVPDSDAWRDDRLVNVLGGFYAFGQELLSRGAHVRLVRLPERSGAKVGLDDWFVMTGNIWESEWPALERVALDHERLGAVAAWWQRWREKQATRDALQAHDQDAVELSETAGLYVVRSAKHAVTLTFDRLTDQRGSVYAEVTITLGSTALLEAVDLNLKSNGSQTTLANSLRDYGASVPWKLLLQRACALVMRQKRLGRPSLILSRHSQVQPLTYAVRLGSKVFRPKNGTSTCSIR